MKHSNFFILTLLLSISVASLFANNYPAPADIVKAYYAALDKGDVTEVGKMMADDFLGNAPFSPQPLPKQAWFGVAQGFKAAFPDMKHEVLDCIESGYKVAVRANFSGKNDGSMMGNPATGNRVSLPFNAIFELDKAWKIKALHVQFDQKLFEAQLMAGLPNPAVKAELDIRAFLAAVDNGDVETALSYCAGNAVHYFGGMATSKENLKKRILGFKAGFPDIKRNVDEVIVSGNVVTLRGWVTGTNTGSFLGTPATGNKVKVSFLSMYKLDAYGKITEGWVEFDRATVEQQLKDGSTAGGR